MAEERMEEEVEAEHRKPKRRKRRNTEECEETAEASAERVQLKPRKMGKHLRKKDKKGFFSGRKKEKKEDAVKAQIERAAG